MSKAVALCVDEAAHEGFADADFAALLGAVEARSERPWSPPCNHREKPQIAAKFGVFAVIAYPVCGRLANA